MIKRLLLVVPLLFLGCDIIDSFFAQASLSFSSNEYYNTPSINFLYDYTEGPNTEAQADLYEWDSTSGTYRFVISFTLDPGLAQNLEINFATLGIGLGEGKYRLIASLSQYRGNQKAVLPGGTSTHDFIFDESPPPAPRISGLSWDPVNFDHLWTNISFDSTTTDTEAPVFLYYANGNPTVPDFTDPGVFDSLPTISPGIFPADPTEPLENWNLYLVARDAAGNTTVSDPTNVDFTGFLNPGITDITPNLGGTLISRAVSSFEITGVNFVDGARVRISDSGSVSHVAFTTWQSDTSLGIYLDLSSASIGAGTLFVENPGSIVSSVGISITN